MKGDLALAQVINHHRVSDSLTLWRSAETAYDAMNDS